MLISLSMASLALVSGSTVGFTLGLVGGGGSILAVPLLIYVVGVSDPHMAIGASAVAVTVNAAMNLAMHAKLGAVKWRCALVFAIIGAGGALAGSSLGKLVDGQRLLALFAVLMIAVSALMLWKREAQEQPEVTLSAQNLPRLASLGLGTGLLSGFFGIGGGFLIVPGLMLATGMPIKNAIGSSLLAVTAFGLATSINYALSGLVDWPIAGLFIVGGFFGGLIGAKSATAMAEQKGMLNRLFAAIIAVVAAYVLWRSLA